MLLNCGVGEDSWESLGLQGDPTSLYSRKSVLNIHWKDRCWSWNSNTLVTWCEELTYWKDPDVRLKAGGESDDRRWDGRMASPTWWTWVWVGSGSWWWIGNPDAVHGVAKNWTRLSNWTDILRKAYALKNVKDQEVRTEMLLKLGLFCSASSPGLILQRNILILEISPVSVPHMRPWFSEGFAEENW